MIRNMGIAVPSEKAKVIIKAWAVTVPDRARLITEARIGPTQGVQSRPRDNPISKPPQKPCFVWPFGVNLTSLLKSCSIKSWS